MLRPAQLQAILPTLISAQQPLCLAEDTQNQALAGRLSVFRTTSTKE